MMETHGRRFRRSFEDRRDSAGTVVTGRSRGAFRVVALLILSFGWILPWSAPASAHARLSEAAPAAGTTIRESPDLVRLRFTEPVEAEFDPIKVFGPGGERVDQRDAGVSPDDARVVEVGLEELPRGTHTVEWRVTSIDGHVVADEYGFEVAEAGEPAGGADEGAGESPDESAPQPAAQEGGSNPVAAYGAASLGVLAVAILAVLGVIALRRRALRP